MTAHGGVTGAVEAIRLGALDYLVKPFEAEELALVIERARRARQSARVEEHRRDDAVKEAFYFGSALATLQGHLEKILAADQRVQGSPAPVLIQGETGTGKTSIARWLHQGGPRGGRELVEVNCSVLPESLAESELFGHERGAFTDARTARMGLFEAANGGTLFLDELPSLSPALQAKVLTAIEDHKIRRVGGNKNDSGGRARDRRRQSRPQGTRAAGAVSRGLVSSAGSVSYHSAAAAGTRRGHSEAGGNVFAPHLPEASAALKKISAEGRQRLLASPWPGNVRELAHELERAVVFEETGELHFAHLAESSRRKIRRAARLG